MLALRRNASSAWKVNWGNSLCGFCSRWLSKVASNLDGADYGGWVPDATAVGPTDPSRTPAMPDPVGRFVGNELVFGSWNWNVVNSQIGKGGDFVSALQMEEQARVDIVTFNLLAPCYKRQSTRNALGRRHRESHDPKTWMPRAELALRFFQEEIMPNTAIMALQEFWMGNETYKSMFVEEFERQGYAVATLQRTGDKMDAVALVVRKSEFDILGQHNIYLQSAERVALLLWLRHKATGKSMIVVNTHLSFPHTSLDRMFQMRQVSYLVKEIEDFGSKNGLTSESSTKIILGDFNVETLSPVCAHLRQAGYFSGMGTALEVEDLEARSDDLLVAGADAPPPSPEHERTAYKRWVSHRTHRAEDLGVDHVYIKPQVERGGARAAGADSGVFVSDARVLPVSLPAESWPLDFRVSDHRPVRVSIVFARVSNEADWVGWN